MKKPIPLRIVVYLMWFHIALVILFIVAANVTVSTKAKSGAWLGVQQAIVSHSSANSVEQYSAYNAGELMGQSAIILVLSGITLAAIAHNRRKPAEICLLIETVIGARAGATPLLQPVCMLLLCVPSVGRYFDFRKGTPPTENDSNVSSAPVEPPPLPELLVPATPTSFKFFCPYCGQHISTTTDTVGAQAACPTCQKAITVPPPIA